jgi:hypothetical protein
MVAAGYTMSPSIQFSQNTGGMGGALGGLSRSLGVIGAIAGGIKTNEAATTLIMIDNRSGVQLAAAEGTAKNTDFALFGRPGCPSGYSLKLPAAAQNAPAIEGVFPCVWTN